MYFDVSQNNIVYETVNDWNSAIVAAKGEKLDLLGHVTNVIDWLDLDDSEKFMDNFNKETPPFMTYSYLGMHMKDPKLADKRVRLAINQLVDVPKINETVSYGMNKRIVGNIIPSMGAAYNHDIEPYQYDLDKAKELLDEAGWKDTNNNGIRDMMIDGKLTELSLNYAFNKGNNAREKIGLIIQEEFKKAGIEINVQAFEWSVYLEKLKNHEDIDMFYSAWVMDPRPSDPIQIWGTDSYNGGSNYCGFGNAETDALIEEIRAELDEDKRNELYHRWQEILHEEVPCVFLFTSDRRMAVHKRFTNLNDGARDPGHWTPGFTLASGFSSFVN